MTISVLPCGARGVVRRLRDARRRRTWRGQAPRRRAWSPERDATPPFPKVSGSEGTETCPYDAVAGGRRLLSLLLVAAVLLAGCAGQQPDAGDAPESLTLALDWTPNTNHTGIYVAQQKGWYEEAGVDLKILPYADGTTTDVLVSNGKADFGISSEESVVLARAAGQDVVSVAAVMQKNTSALVTLKSSGIDRPKALTGKRYAGFGAPFEEPVISTMIEHDGGGGA
ncbi:MAG: ABC transporter substrate-binding protein, partial [Chloroflexota bacterium]|nr:ABC transporter substrate-binding protein [Chloroflexota bacterium]